MAPLRYIMVAIALAGSAAADSDNIVVDAPRGTVVAIIGGSRGIGLDAARYMALYGCTQPASALLTILITCRLEPDCIDAVLSIEAAMAETCVTSERVKIAAFSPFDVTNEGDIFRLGGFLSSSYDGVDTILYNAGALVQDIAYTVRVHFVGFWTTVEALRPILRRPGRVVAVTSFLGRISQLPENLRRSDRRWQLDAAYNMFTERPDPKSIHESLIEGGWHLYNPHTHSMHPYAYSKNLQNLAVRRIAAETAADTELEVNAVCPGGCATGINPGGTDTPRKCIETIMWLSLGRRNSSLGGRVHGGFFRYMSPAKGKPFCLVYAV
jgi:NAD(P)-dependent dehydrogenase (short-subunit alcohol dehydrogenase family)